jgi:membrane fusion protein (multidrug efflux system)
VSRHSRRTNVVPLLALLATVTACSTQDSAPPAATPLEVFVTEVVVADVPIYGEWVGETRGRADIEIRARVQGFLEAIHFREGGTVKKGQLLYSIDKSELLQEHAASEASLAASQTELAYAQTDVARYRPLAEMNAVSQRDLDSAVARHDAAEAQVEAAKALLRLSEINLSYAEIRAPMNGLIGLSKAKVGDYVGQSPNPVVLNTLSDIDPIHVRFPVGEREYLNLARRLSSDTRDEEHEENRVSLELILADGTQHPHTGRSEFVERNIDSSTGTLIIEAAFPNPERILRPGQYGRVRAITEVLQQARLIPQRSVQELQGQFQVWVVADGGSVELRNVQMGRRVDRMWVVESGIDLGDRVVVEGIQRLQSGMTVNAQPWTAPTVAETAASEG